MRIMAAVVTIFILTLIAAIGGASSTTAAPEPSPSTVPAPPPVVVPASRATIHWAKAMHRRCVRARAAVAFADSCMSRKTPPSVAALLGPSASQEQQTAAGSAWRAQARHYRKVLAVLVARMKAPGGRASASKWIPLLKWTGWAAWAISGAVAHISRESGGNFHEWNRGGSPCYGGFQIHRCWWGAKGFAWIDDALNQCRLAWHIFHKVQHDSWDPAWAL